MTPEQQRAQAIKVMENVRVADLERTEQVWDRMLDALLASGLVVWAEDELPAEMTAEEWTELRFLGERLRDEHESSVALIHAMRAAARAQRVSTKLKERNGAALRAEHEVQRLTAERDELLAVLRDYIYPRDHHGGISTSTLDRIHALLAKYEAVK